MGGKHLFPAPAQSCARQLGTTVGAALLQHLAVLRESAIVQTQRESQTVTYSLPEGVVTRLIDVLYQEFCKR
jgi:DNA-binding transcriptional ArsR family regulator